MYQGMLLGGGSSGVGNIVHKGGACNVHVCYSIAEHDLRVATQIPHRMHDMMLINTYVCVWHKRILLV